MDRLVETLGIASFSKSQVSVIAKALDTAVEGVPQPAGRWTPARTHSGAADALVLKAREGAGGQRARADHDQPGR
jgi:putative transposase